MLELTLRLIASLALVVGLLLLVVRIGGRRFQGRADAPVRVVHRQALSRSSSVAVLEIGGRVLVVGATDHQVSMLTELDPEDLSVVDATPAAAPFASALDSAVRELHVVPATAEPEAVESVEVVEAEELAPTGTDAAPAPVRRRGGAHAARRSDRAARPARSTRAALPTRAARPGEGGPLAGSVLSPDTWKQAVAAARGRR